MLHIATVHYGSPRWIEIQGRHLREHISEPFQTWASLEGIDPSHARQFDHVIPQIGPHAGKLNGLALEIAQVAAGSDLLMFLDGDAFPIADPMPLVHAALARAPLLAVRRAENVGDLQPHPCFCVTTVEAWQRLRGDWSMAHVWLDSKGRPVSDAGGNLLRTLELSGTPWVPLLRSNRVDLDPIFFAIYGDVIYHHGAGFRGSEFARVHLERAPARRPMPRLALLRPFVRRTNARRRRWARETKREQQRNSRRLLAKLESGDPSWLSELR
jgi:hypothetical protein